MMERVETVERVSFFKDGDVIILNDFEKIREGVALLGQFFWAFSCHDPKGVVMSGYREGAFFYCCPLPSPMSLEQRFKVNIIDLHLPEGMKVPSVFFDIRTEEDTRGVDLFSLPPQTVYYFLLNSQKIGIYFQRNRLLIASDWTHNSECVHVMRQLLPQICKFFKKRSSRAPRISFRLTFGGDPEFEMFDMRTRKIASASEIVHGGTLSSHEIGVDGAGYQVEIRPSPSAHIDKFVKNFRDILLRFSREYPEYTLSAQGNRYPLGGHIHLGISPTQEIVDLLDHWVGEKVVDLSGTARGSYKKLGAIERKPWGFEYRTPPAAIFLSPSVLRAVLKIIKRVIGAYCTRDGVALYPSDDEIRRLGIERDWKVLEDFVSNYHSFDKDVMKNWRIKVQKVYNIDLVFRDDWEDEVKSFVKELFFRKLSKRLTKRLSKQGIYRVVLFGLRRERGEVCSFPNHLFSVIDYAYFVDNGLPFGFPLSVRMPDEFTDEIKKKWSILVDDIMRELRRRVRSGE